MAEKGLWPAKAPAPGRVCLIDLLAFGQESFETAVSSVSTSNRRWAHDPKTADGCYEPQQYKSCNKGRDDSSSSGVGPAYALRSQESAADGYRRRGNDNGHDSNGPPPPPSLPADDRRRTAADEPESPRVLPGVPTGTAAAVHPPGPDDGSGFTYPGGPVKHFAPSTTLQQHKQQQLKKQRDSVGDADGGGLPDRRLDEDDDDGGGKEAEDEDDEDEDEDELSAEDAGPPDDELLPAAPVEKGNLARMRWHKAYNKIVHQLNVSTFAFHRPYGKRFFSFYYRRIVYCRSKPQCNNRPHRWLKQLHRRRELLAAPNRGIRHIGLTAESRLQPAGM